MDNEERAKLQPKRNDGENNEQYYKRCWEAGYRNAKIKGSCTIPAYHGELSMYTRSCNRCEKRYHIQLGGFCYPDKDGGIE